MKLPRLEDLIEVANMLPDEDVNSPLKLNINGIEVIFDMSEWIYTTKTTTRCCLWGCAVILRNKKIVSMDDCFFKLGDVENLPKESKLLDVIVSENLTPVEVKRKFFQVL